MLLNWWHCVGGHASLLPFSNKLHVLINQLTLTTTLTEHNPRQHLGSQAYHEPPNPPSRGTPVARRPSPLRHCDPGQRDGVPRYRTVSPLSSHMSFICTTLQHGQARRSATRLHNRSLQSSEGASSLSGTGLSGSGPLTTAIALPLLSALFSQGGAHAAPHARIRIPDSLPGRARLRRAIHAPAAPPRLRPSDKDRT